MACGAAVIGTDVPGIREVIEDGRTGLLCAPTAAALRDAIERLLSDEPLRRRLGGNARQQIEMTASLDRVAELELSAYRATLSEPLKEPHLGSRSEEHTSELQSLMRISYAVFCLKKKNTRHRHIN